MIEGIYKILLKALYKYGITLSLFCYFSFNFSHA